MELTARQAEILEFIREFRRREGCSPSIPEVQREFGFRSPNAVASHLKALEAKGQIRRSSRGSRQVDVVAGGEAGRVPLLGAIPAGRPESVGGDGREGYVTVDLEELGFRAQRGCYALRVRGDSMRDAAILDGDVVVIQPAPNPKAGQIVAALIDGESTLKRLVQVKGKWFLKAENPEYPQLIPRSDLVIQGVVQFVIRAYRN